VSLIFNFPVLSGDNPHLGHLAWADTFIVTADSVSMLSEACSTGKPVYVVGGDRCRGKIAAFHRTLQARGATRPFTGTEDVSGLGRFLLRASLRQV
jgi:mitochondrial fission protein ELM1